MIDYREYHFLLDWKNIHDLKQLVDMVIDDPELWLDIQFQKPFREIHEHKVMEYGPAQLHITLTRAVDSGGHIMQGSLHYKETNERSEEFWTFPRQE